MADWYGHARTNYFKVKDIEKFKEFCDTFYVEMIEQEQVVLKQECYQCLHNNKIPEDCKQVIKRTVGECKGEKIKEQCCGFLGTDTGAIVGYAEDIQGNPLEFDDMVKMLATHLEEGWVAILQEVGAEKLRYITGYSLAVNHLGETVDIDINNIYQKAENLGRCITRCEY